jgi:hypothetical protein
MVLRFCHWGETWHKKQFSRATVCLAILLVRRTSDKHECLRKYVDSYRSARASVCRSVGRMRSLSKLQER